jgi:hypothetical protein
MPVLVEHIQSGTPHRANHLADAMSWIARMNETVRAIPPKEPED